MFAEQAHPPAELAGMKENDTGRHRRCGSADNDKIRIFHWRE